MNFSRIILYLLYISTLCATVYLVFYGYGYYGSPLIDRPHNELHDALKPSGFWGHGLGIVGALMMLMLLIYIARKYLRFMQRWGNIRHWLNIHIWLGITGPILITFHTAFKFGGIVSVSFWSMVAVAASGFFGRYIYLQIPRRLSGEEMTADELQEIDEELSAEIMNSVPNAESLTKKIQLLAGIMDGDQISRSEKIRSWLMDNVKLRFQLRKLRSELRRGTQLSSEVISRLIHSIHERHLLKRRIAFLKVARRILHHWHLIHRPFAVVMYIVFVVHVVVAILFGYKWIF